MYKMYIAWAFCTCWVTLALAEPPKLYALENATALFEEFVTTYSKTYADDQERESRLAIFKNNLEIVNGLNLESNDTVYGITKFMDITPEEFSSDNCIPPNTVEEVESEIDFEGNANVTAGKCNMLKDKDITAKGAPDVYDWRAQGAVTPARDQGPCGSCYAFNAVGHLEGRYYIKHKQLVELSPQQIVDCDTLSFKCKGGWTHKSFISLIKLGGAMKEVDYPYRPLAIQTCRSDKKKAVVKLKRCFTYDLQSQEKVKQLLHSVGPISVVIRYYGFQYYRGGIVNDNICNRGDLDHGVLLVGYGSENGFDYWIVKNTRGANWGESGYFRMRRGEGKVSCGMMNTMMTTADIK